MENNVSTVAFRSNLYPIEKSFHEDSVFRSKIHDPFSLEILKKQCALTVLQKREYEYASVHCAYAAKNDYPWGTIRDNQGHEQVICRCLNTKCSHFYSCRPDFDPAELAIHEENKRAQPAIFEFEEAVRKKHTAEDGDVGAAVKLFAGNHSEQKNTGEQESPAHAENKPDLNDPFVIRKPAPQIPNPVSIKKIDFSSFTETTQDEIIEANPTDRSVINAGPGTGKTWTLIEKIIHMINEGQVEAENILVLCFSRSAVEVVRSRLSDAAESGRIGYEWQDVDVRTFDSFSTYMLAWVQDNHKELLPNHFLLEEYDYNQRIEAATSVFEKKQDMLADYEHIIIDEVQDLVGSRAELVLAMLKGLPDSCGFTILGDSCQALYDYMAEGNPMIMSSEEFYRNVFKSFPCANYYALTENHRQGDTFGQLTVPYRKAILTGSTQDRVSAANDLLTHIPRIPIKLTKFSRSDALRYIAQGETLGILTRTNGQALQISAWLQNANVPHTLHRGLGLPTLGDWIARIFCDYENESVDENVFVAKHLALFPQAGYETAHLRWMALVSTQQGEARNRYEVTDLLKGLLRNAKDPMLYESGTASKNSITVSNIHRAKGKEYDSVIVIDDVIEAMADPGTEDLLEHKVCYVALTRSKKKIERAEISKKDKQIYITRNDDHSKRCAKAGGFKRYISHFEVGSDTDLDMRSLAADNKIQQNIRNSVHLGMRLKLIKCPEGAKSYVTYRVVLEDNEKFVLGYTSKSFARELEKAIQHIKNINCSVYYQVYPHAFCDVYIHKITTCVSEIDPIPEGARTFGDVGIWSGITITGFAAVDKDTY
jgi:superfamily I DNA/RNA helicase